MMKKREWKYGITVWSIGWLCIVSACSDKGKGIIDEETKTQRVNHFIVDMMSDAYLWTKTVNWDAIDYKTEANSQQLFKKIRHKHDRWSMLTDRVSELQNAFQGVSTTFGYQLIFGRFSNKNALFAIVLFVYPNTPAEKAGIKRGDFLVGLNGGDITETNYRNLYYASSISVKKGVLVDGKISTEPADISMKAVKMYEDSILKDSVIVKGAHKIGYLCYADYTMDSEPRLLEIFSKFKTQGVTDVVLDLRYNGGGTARTSRLLCSILGPQSAVKKKSKLLSQVWNDKYMKLWKEKKMENRITEYFIDTLSVNMNLSRLYVLTTRRTASASESTITGLHPYLDLVQIGDTTSGKFCGGILVNPEDLWGKGEVNDIKDWGIYMMVYRFANINNDEFINGIVPKHAEKENYHALYPFGDERDLLFGKAVSLITGQPMVKARSQEQIPPYTILPVEDRRALNEKMISTLPSGMELLNSPLAE